MNAFTIAMFPLAGYLLALVLFGLAWMIARARGTERVTIRFLFEPRDLWIGVFVDTAKCRIYVLPLPCIGIVVAWGGPNHG